MWQLYAIIANDLIRERQAEAEAQSLYRALLLNPDAGPRPAGPGLARRLSVGGLRRIEAAAAWISRHASSTASRLEREPA
jgi:hypothetical protein